MPKRRVLAPFLMLAVAILTACGDDGSSSSSPLEDASSDIERSAEDVTGDAEDAVGDAEDLAERMVEDLEKQQAARGGGSAELVVGDDSWEFDSVLCAFGEDEIGQEGAEFVLSSLKDGLQLYVSIDSFGHSVDLNDVANFANPSVSLSAFGDGMVEVDGKDVRAEGDFMDDTSDDFETISGTLTATCP